MHSAQVEAKARLAELAAAVSLQVAALALRTCPPLPETVAERLRDYRAQNVADSVMYRNALAEAARERGWLVHWYDARSVLDDAARALGRKTMDELLAKTGAAVGPPWQKDHRQAMAAAIAATAMQKTLSARSRAER